MRSMTRREWIGGAALAAQAVAEPVVRLPQKVRLAIIGLEGQWRLEVLPADFARVGSEVRLSELYSSFLDAGNWLYFASQRQGQARATFQAAEENRAASLHALEALPGDWREKLPARYWESLAQLHAMEVELLSVDSEPLREESRRLRSAVLEMEARAGGQIPKFLPAGWLSVHRRTWRPTRSCSVSISGNHGRSYGPSAASGSACTPCRAKLN